MAVPRVVLRVLLAAVLLGAGVAVGLASVVVHDLTWGLPLAIAATAACLWVVPGGWGLRLPFGLGWALVAVVGSRPRPEGDYLISNNLHGWVLLGFGVGVLAVSIVSVRPLHPAEPPETQPLPS